MTPDWTSHLVEEVFGRFDLQLELDINRAGLDGEAASRSINTLREKIGEVDPFLAARLVPMRTIMAAREQKRNAA